MVDTPLHHPERDELVAFGLGKLPPDEATEIETHLGQCDVCCETLLDLQDDTFVSLVRKSPEPKPGEPGAHEPLARHGADIQATLDSESSVAGQTDNVAELPDELRRHPRYEILELIGRGGMGDVYKAQHRVMNRTVALKVIRPELVRNATAVDRFQREVQAAARLHDGNIVTAYDAEQAGNLHFLVMEFVDGIDLSQVVRDGGPLPVAEACEYIRQAAMGLEHARQLGMVHRDIKPHNLMLTDAGEVKILDFGLANFASEVVAEEAGDGVSDCAGAAIPLQQLTQLGTMMGTPDYIAPEQAEDARAADIRSDIYSLGCTLCFLLTGKPLFEAMSVTDKLQAHAEHQPPKLTDTRSDIPPELQEVVDRMLAKDPARRFQTPSEVADALAPFVDQHRTGGGTPTSHVAGVSVPPNPLPITFALCFAGTLSTLAFVLGGMLFMSAGWLAGLPNWLRLWLQFGGIASLPVGVSVLILADRSERKNSRSSAVKAGCLNLLPVNPFLVVLLPLTIWTLLKLRKPSALAMYEHCPPLDAAETRRRWPIVITTTACLVIAIYAGTVFLVHLGATTLRFEINDPELAVRFGDRTISVDNDGRAFHIKPGTEQQFIVEQNGLEVESDSLTLRQGDKVVLRVSMVDGRAAVNAEGADVTVRATPMADSGDLARIQGTWVAESGQRGGQSMPLEQIPMQRVVFRGDKLTATMPTGLTGEDGMAAEGVFQLKTDVNPKQIWLQVKGRSDGMRGIYQLEGDRLILCMNQDRNGPLPESFETTSRMTLDMIVFQRIPDKVAMKQAPAAPVENALQDQILAEIERLVDPRTTTANVLPVVLRERDRRAAFRFGKWLLVFDAIALDTKGLVIGGISGFNYPSEGGRGEGTIRFNSQLLPDVQIKQKWDGKQNEITVQNYRFKLFGKGERLEFGDRDYTATSEVQTIIVNLDGSTRLETQSDDQTKDSPRRTDADRLQGTWVPVSGHIRAQPMSPEQLANMSVTLEGNRVTLTDPDSGQTIPAGTFAINADRDPHHITLSAPDGSETLPGIFQFHGDLLKLAWNDEDYTRPTDFEPAQTPDHMTAVLKLVPGTVPQPVATDTPDKAAALDEEQQRVLEAAEEFLSVMDEGRFGELFDLASSWARKGTSREETSRTHQAIRDAFGKALQRTLLHVQLLEQDPNLPKGRYAGVQYKSRFERQGVLWETLLLNVDTDGTWRINTYANTLQQLPLPHTDRAEQQKIQAALAAAGEWLKLVDAEKYDEAWETSAKINRDAVTKQKLADVYNELFQPLGPIKTRVLVSNEYKTQMPNAPVGDYAVLQYRSEFTSGRVIETVVLTKESDSQWRVSGYFQREDSSLPTPPADESQSRPARRTGILTNPPTVPEGGLPTGKNLIGDSSLEDTPLGELPNTWSAWLNDGPDFQCEAVEGGVTGKHCLQISGTGTRGVVFTTSIPMDRTKRYALKGHVKVEGDAGTWAVIKLNYFNKTGWLGVDDRVGVESGESGWQFFEKTDRSDAFPEATLMVPTCHIEGNGTAWFDDLEVIAYDRDQLPEDFDKKHGKNNRMYSLESSHR